MARAQAMISEMDVTRAYQVTKAFAIYFELTNLAETNHRKRRRRARQLDRQGAPLPGSFQGTLLRMKEAGLAGDAAIAALRRIMVTPVFTAHPTEVARQTVLVKRRRIAEQLERLDRLPLTLGEALRCEQIIHAEITSLWQTDEVRQTKPTVDDEIRMGLRYFRLSLFETLPRIYTEVAESVREVYGTALDAGGVAESGEFWFLDWRRPRRQSAGQTRMRERCPGTGAGSDSGRIHPPRGVPERLPEFVAAAGAALPRRFCRAWRTMNGRCPASPCCGDRATLVEHYRRFLSYVVHRLQRSREGPGTQGSYERCR